MSVIKEEDLREETVKDVAKKMLVAARTAPKGKGINNMVLLIAGIDEIKLISDKLKEIGQRDEVNVFLRDAENILFAQAMVILGSKIQPLGLKKCGMCGFTNCDEKNKHINIPCVFNTGDLGIAIGSAVSVAMDNRVDNRIMYTAGQAVLEMGLLGEDVKIIYCIPLSASSKNIFFDRKEI